MGLSMEDGTRALMESLVGIRESLYRPDDTKPITVDQALELAWSELQDVESEPPMTRDRVEKRVREIFADLKKPTEKKLWQAIRRETRWGELMDRAVTSLSRLDMDARKRELEGMPHDRAERFRQRLAQFRR